MKKYIYAFVLSISLSMAYGQTISTHTIVWGPGDYDINHRPLLISINKLNVQEVDISSYLDVVPGAILTTESWNLNQPISANAVENSSSTDGNMGLEGHNFVEDPAIIYPNPVKDIMQIKSTDPITVIEILNVHGESVKLLDTRSEQLDVSNLPAGNYYVRISFEHIKKVQVERILVVK